VKKVLKFLLIVLVWLLIAAVIIGGAAIIGYEPIENAIKLFIGIFVGWYTVRFIWRLIVRYRAKKRVEQLVNVEDPSSESRNFALGFKWWNQASQTETRFKSILSFIKSSSLEDHGDPLYVLPWYFVIGDESSRQNQLLNTLQLPAPTIDNDILHCAQNENNWHLYNDTLLIEVPDTYRASSSDPAKAEWVETLSLLESSRTSQPLNGVIIAISVEQLMGVTTDDLLEKARKQRRLLEDAQQVLGVQVPVTVILTGINSLPGVDKVISMLDENQLTQVLGQPVASGQKSEQLITDVLQTFSRLAHQKMLMMLKQKSISSDQLRLSAQLELLEKSLGLYVKTLFEKNLYEHTPVMSGLYMVAQYQKADDKIAKSVFVDDLFTQIIPQDRHEVAFLNNAKKKSLKAHSKTIASTAIAVTVIAFLSAVYCYHEGHIDEMLTHYYQDYDNGGALPANVNNLLLYKSIIDQSESVSWIPWYAPGSQPAFISSMQVRLAERVDDELVSVVDDIFKGTLKEGYFKKGNMQDTVDYLGILVRRINILKALLAGAGYDELMGMPAPYDVRSLGVADEDLVDGINSLYLQSLVWQQLEASYDVSLQEHKLAGMQDELQLAITASDNSLYWIVDWLNENPSLKSYSVSDAWSMGGGEVKKDYVVPRAYTKNGKEQADAFIVEIKQALDSNDTELKVLINQLATDFDVEYRKQFIKSWEQYALNFNDGIDTLQNRKEWVSVANNLGSGKNPYLQALNVVSDELSVIEGGDLALPDWVVMVQYYQDMRAMGPDDGTDNSKRNKIFQKMLLKTIAKAGPVGKALAKQGKSGMKTQKKLDKASGGSSVVDLRAENLEKAAKFLQDYHVVLDEFVYNAEVQSESFNAVSSVFSHPDNPAKAEGPYGKAFATVQELQALVGKSNRDNKAFWLLYMGSLDFMLEYMAGESACYLNEFWRDEFLADLESVPDYKKDSFLMGEGGALWLLLDGKFKPFIKKRYGAGYTAKKVSGRSPGLSERFFNYASRAQDMSRLPKEYKVFLKGMPTSVNTDAIMLVEKTSLKLSCGAGPQKIVNHNFPVEKEFVWTPDCADTSLNLKVGHLNIEKSYDGASGFQDFLQAFSSGSQRFTPEDFPRGQEELIEMGIKYIDVKFEVRGSKSLLRDLNKRPPKIPQNIAHCWI